MTTYFLGTLCLWRVILKLRQMHRNRNRWLVVTVKRRYIMDGKKFLISIATAIILVISPNFVLSVQAATCNEHHAPVENTNGYRYSQGYSASHKAIDFTPGAGTKVMASKAGTIYGIFTGCTNVDGARVVSCSLRGRCSPSDGYYNGYCNYGFGNGYLIKHSDGTTTAYAHLATTAHLQGTLGQAVAQGQQIGTVGSSGMSTGYHLHFEMARISSFTTINAFLNAPHLNPYDVCVPPTHMVH